LETVTGDARIYFGFAITLAVRKLIFVLASALAIPLLIFAQMLSRREAALLLPVEQRISGVVTDTSGRPIADASVEHVFPPDKKVLSDASGRFDLTTRAPTVVIRKLGFDSAFVRNNNAELIHITLIPGGSALPTCPSKLSCKMINGWSSTFCFPDIDGVNVSKQVHDIDFGMRIYSVGSTNAFIRHGSGGNWSYGVPEYEDVWDSVDYSEKTYVVAGTFIVDARGKSKTANFWRYLGRQGESASYSGVDEKSAAILDRVLDGICIRDGKR
jgi:hypothetical protein